MTEFYQVIVINCGLLDATLLCWTLSMALVIYTPRAEDSEGNSMDVYLLKITIAEDKTLYTETIQSTNQQETP